MEKAGTDLLLALRNQQQLQLINLESFTKSKDKVIEGILALNSLGRKSNHMDLDRNQIQITI